MALTQQVKARNDKGDELAISTHDSDSPILPVAALERLHQFRPDLVDFFMDETRKEAKHRRSNTTAVNYFVFIERIFGMLCSVFIGVCGIYAAGYLGLRGQPVLGGSIATLALGTLAIAFIAKKSGSKPKEGGRK